MNVHRQQPECSDIYLLRFIAAASIKQWKSNKVKIASDTDDI